jgi:hypothetical protein
MDYAKEVKKIHPKATPFAGVMGWGIHAPGIVLAYGAFKTVDAAWKRAWERISVK